MQDQVMAKLSAGFRLFLLALAVFANLSACTSAVRQDSSSIPKFESVAIKSMGVTNKLRARLGPAEDESTDAGAVVGAGAGAMVGAQASLVCVGFAYLCAVATVPIGAMIGAVGGGLTDYAVDSQKELSRDQLLVLNSLFGQILHDRSIHQDIENRLMGHIPATRIIDVPGADTLIQFRLYDVRFFRTSLNKYALTLKTVMLVKWNRNSSQALSTHRTYEHTSHSLQMEDWVQDDGKTLNLAFDACIDGLTEKMLADIQFENP